MTSSARWRAKERRFSQGRLQLICQSLGGCTSIRLGLTPHREKFRVQVKPWFISLAIFPFSVAYLRSRWKASQPPSARPISEREQQIADVQRWVWIGLGIAVVGLLGFAFALGLDSSPEPFLTIAGTGLVMAFVARVASGWIRSGSAK